MSGIKFDDVKAKLDLAPCAAMFGLSYGMTLGSIKYDSHNWTKGLSYRRLIGAAMRHLTLFNLGEDDDPIESGGSGLPHLWHAADCVTMLIDTTILHPELDDRCKYPVEAIARLREQMVRAEAVLALAIKKREEEDASRAAVEGNGKANGAPQASEAIEKVVELEKILETDKLFEALLPDVARPKAVTVCFNEVRGLEIQHKTFAKRAEWRVGGIIIFFQHYLRYEQQMTLAEAEKSCEILDILLTVIEPGEWQVKTDNVQPVRGMGHGNDFVVAKK